MTINNIVRDKTFYLWYYNKTVTILLKGIVMQKEETQIRLEIIKLAIGIRDDDTIILQTTHLKSLNNNNIDEIILMLSKKNYKQALYLIKNYLADNAFEEMITPDINDNGEKVLGIEDMLRMSPLAKETIKDYKAHAYTQDDLEAFAKNIEMPVTKSYEKTPKIDDYVKTFNKIQEEAPEVAPEIKEEPLENPTELDTAVQNADKDTPLDEISAEVLGKKNKKEKTKRVVSKYKTLKSKFAKKDKNTKNEEKEKKKSSVAKTMLNKAKGFGDKLSVNGIKKTSSSNEEKTSNIKRENISSNEKVEKNSAVSEKNEIYSPIPNIEQKFRQSFVIFPPIKQSDIWVKEVVDFLKKAAYESYSDYDVQKLLDEYSFYLEKNDISKAAQVLLLAASTDSKFAQFLLARELFSGKVLKRDLTKSFKLMKSLANKFYPDAVCDLAQFYEYGITVPKNKKIALRLYEKAFELGVDRATKHINRIKESKGIFSSILNKL